MPESQRVYIRNSSFPQACMGCGRMSEAIASRKGAADRLLEKIGKERVPGGGAAVFFTEVEICEADKELEAYREANAVYEELINNCPGGEDVYDAYQTSFECGMEGN